MSQPTAVRFATDLSFSDGEGDADTAEAAFMNSTEILAQFSQNRLNGEPVPDDLKILLPHRDELAKRTGIRLELADGWAPWLETSHLSEADRRDPDIVANLRAIHSVCAHIAFIAAKGDEEFFGYWRGPGRRSVANSPIVFFDNEDQFHLCIAASFAEAVLEQAYGGEGFNDLRAWLQSLGISIGWDSPSQLTYPHEKLPPKELHKVLFQRYRTASPQRP